MYVNSILGMSTPPRLTKLYALYSTHFRLSTSAKAMENRKISSDMKNRALKLWAQGWDTEDTEVSSTYPTIVVDVEPSSILCKTCPIC
jgi:hypothetical protein